MSAAQILGTESFDLRIRQGLACRSCHDLVGAIREFSAAWELRPQSVGARSELAFTQLQAGALDEAQIHFLAVLGADSNNVAALAGLAAISRRRSDLPAALAYLQQAISIDPERLSLRCELADVLKDSAKPDLAAETLRAVLERDPTHRAALVGLGSLARDRGDQAASVAHFERALDANPDHSGIQLELGLSLRNAALHQRAIALYKSMLERDASNVDARVGLSMAFRQAGDLAGAVQSLKEASASRPQDATIRLELAAAFRDLAQWQEAEREYGAVLDKDPENWAAWVGRGVMARQQGDNVASLSHFQAAQVLRPQHAGVQGELALTLRLLGRLDEAEAIYQRALEVNPQAVAPLQGLSLIELSRGRLDAAIRYAQSALDLEPGNVERKVFLAALYRDSRQFDEAAALVEACLSSAPRHVGAWLERGMQWRCQNERARALGAFQQAALLDEQRGLSEVAREHMALGNPGEARATYQRILQNFPNDYAAMLGLTELDLIATDYDACIATCDALLAAYPQRVAPYRQKCRALIQLDRAEEAMHTLEEMVTVAGSSAEADAVQLELFRICGRRDEAQAMLSMPRLEASKAFPVWLEKVLTRLTFFDLDGAREALESPPAVRAFERSRVMYARGLLADLEWKLDEAIEWFERALQIHSDDPGAHHHLARLCFLKADVDGAQHHLRAVNRLSASALSLRGESSNISQNLLGQLVNELRLDGNVQKELARQSHLEPTQRREVLAGLVRSVPDLTSPAIGYMLALRQSAAFKLDDPPVGNASSTQAVAIPRKIMQYWDQTVPPDGVTELLRTWVEAHPGYIYCRFDHGTAREYLTAHYPKEVLDAYRRARHPAQASDVFRLAYLCHDGGFYVDADDRCVGHLGSVRVPGATLIGYQEQYASLGNNFLGCVPGEPVIERALTLAVESLNRGDSDALWLATGPGLLTRAFTEILAKQGGEWKGWLQQRRVLDRTDLSKISWPHSISQYKRTGRSWLRSTFSRHTAH